MLSFSPTIPEVGINPTRCLDDIYTRRPGRKEDMECNSTGRDGKDVGRRAAANSKRTKLSSCTGTKELKCSTEAIKF